LRALSYCGGGAPVHSEAEPLAGQSARLTTKVALGMTVYNGRRFLPTALESILQQQYRDFTLVILDDCSQDDSPEIIKRFAALDRRVVAFRNSERNGMIKTWVKVFRLCQDQCPNNRYFAWCSDHDVLRPNWLGPLVDVLDRKDDVVLAYPRTLHIDEEGHLLRKPHRPAKFATTNISDPLARFRFVNENMVGAGNMIYGLFRSEMLDRIGVYRETIMPDRLAMIELSLHGNIYQIPHVLRLRRETARPSIRRQKQSLFTPGKSSRAQTIPWYVWHALLFFQIYRRRANWPGRYSIFQVVSMSTAILLSQFSVEWRKKWKRTYKGYYKYAKTAVKRLKHLSEGNPGKAFARPHSLRQRRNSGPEADPVEINPGVPPVPSTAAESASHAWPRTRRMMRVERSRGSPDLTT
jgi:glycosyltransferase involved in cell wall biosynthesis